MANKKSNRTTKKPARGKAARGKPAKKSKGRSGGRGSSPWDSRSSKKKSRKKAAAKGAAPKKPRKAPRRRPTAGEKRLQLVMAEAGIGSRRDCETIIEEGRVEVDGDVVTKLGTRVNPEKQKIRVDGDLIKTERLQYFMLNKPAGVLSTSNDPSGRTRVIDLIQTTQRVYNVGRLDQSSEGLILVTNDGQLAHRLTHPRYGVEKKYHVQVDGRPDGSDLKTLEQGVYLAEGKAKAQSAKFIKRSKQSCWIEIVLTEGRNREIRRLLARIGHKVRTLKRVAIGPLKLADLPTGAHRRLTATEVEKLKKASRKASPRKRSPKKSSSAKGFDEYQSERESRQSKKKPARKGPARKKSAPARGGRPARPAKGAARKKSVARKRKR